MTENEEYIIENIDFSMRMEDMPLTARKATAISELICWKTNAE